MKENTFLVLTLLSILACNSDDGVASGDRIFNLESSLSHDAKIRTYHIHFPPDYYETNESFPLVLGFHGGGGSAEQFEQQSELNDKADAAGFVMVYPDGLPNPVVPVRSWNAGKCCGANASTLQTDDVGFVSSLLEQLKNDYRINAKRIYATGHSNGGMFCYRLADELSESIAAIAPNAGNFQVKSPYDPERNVPVLQIISLLDENVIYGGGMTNGPGGQYNPPIDSCLDVVALMAGCTAMKQLKQSFPTYSIFHWRECTDDNFEVLLYLTNDGGHSWPGGNKGSAMADDPSSAFKNNDIIWEFFQRFSLP